MSRAMIAQVLFNYTRDAVSGESADFTDVSADDWYSAAVSWAVENGIVNGYGETYGAADPVRRQDLATMLYRYAQAGGYEISDRASLDSFADADQVRDYAQEAMEWAVGAGLIGGFEDGSLRPDGYASRAQVAAIMARFVANV